MELKFCHESPILVTHGSKIFKCKNRVNGRDLAEKESTKVSPPEYRRTAATEVFEFAGFEIFL